MLFVGKLDFRPNAVALAWFIREVLPRLGEARLFAVGDAPPRWLFGAGQRDPRIAVTGYVADERPYFSLLGARAARTDRRRLAAEGPGSDGKLGATSRRGSAWRAWRLSPTCTTCWRIRRTNGPRACDGCCTT